MLQWPTDTFKPDQCDIMNASMPYIFTITNYSKSYDPEDAFISFHGNITEAWKQGGVSMKEVNHTNSTNIGIGQVKTAACGIGNTAWLAHFPHLMQNLYPCWSLWQHFPDAEHVFFLGDTMDKNMINGSVLGATTLKLFEAENISFITMPKKPYIEEFKDRPNELLFVGGKIVSSHWDVVEAGGYRAPHKDDMSDFRTHVLNLFGLDRYVNQVCGMTSQSDAHEASPKLLRTNGKADTGDGSNAPTRRPPRIVIANRFKTRKLLGAHNISVLLQEELNLPYTPPIFFIEHLPAEQQLELFSNIDILLTPHGAMLTNIPFMPRCSSVIEVIPRAYPLGRYFGTLAAISGVNHSYVYLGEDLVADTVGWRTRKLQARARSFPLCAPVHALIEAVKIQVDQWHQCCGFAG